MRIATIKKMYRVTGWTLLLIILSSCAAETSSGPNDAAFEDMLAHSFGASGVAFSSDSRQVAIGTREKIWVVDTATLETTASLSYLQAAKFGNNKSLHFIENQQLIVGAEGVILIWDVTKDRVKDQLSLPDRSFIPRAIAWSEAGQILAFSSGTGTEPVKTVRIDERGFGPISYVPGFEGVPSDLQFSRDGQYLAASGDGEGVFIREVETGKSAGELPTQGYVSDLELFGKKQLLVAGENIAFWTFLSEEEALEMDNPNLQGQINGQVAARVAGGVALGVLTLIAIPFAVFSGDGSAISDLASATYQVASLPVQTQRQRWCGRSTAISPDGRLLADVYPGITKEVIQVFDMETGQTLKSLNPRGHYSCALKFSPNGKQLLITTEKTVRLYDTETWRFHDLKLD